MAREVDGGRGDAWKDDLAQFLRQSDAYQVLGSDNGDDSAGEADAGGETEVRYPLGDLIRAHYRKYNDYVLPIGHRVAESGERGAGSYALYMVGIAIPDPRVQKSGGSLIYGRAFPND